MPPSPLPLIALALVLFIAALAAGRAWARHRIGRWCRQQGYELLEWRGAWFYEGPHKWLRSENQSAYYIEVRDRQGLTRAGYLVFGSYWFPFGKVEVTWD